MLSHFDDRPRRDLDRSQAESASHAVRREDVDGRRKLLSPASTKVGIL
jgi:hypothetical protein